MRTLIAIFLIFVLLLPLMIKVTLVVHWKINQKEIEERYCVNKAKPEMECHGQCHLNKELQSIDDTSTTKQDKEMPAPFAQKIKTKISCFIVVFSTLCFAPFKQSAIASYKAYFKASLYLFFFSFQCFRPPQDLL